jgi:hypothetical protein
MHPDAVTTSQLVALARCLRHCADGMSDECNGMGDVLHNRSQSPCYSTDAEFLCPQAAAASRPAAAAQRQASSWRCAAARRCRSIGARRDGDMDALITLLPGLHRQLNYRLDWSLPSASRSQTAGCGAVYAKSSHILPAKLLMACC